ncbi:MAG: hypothetical protein H0X37_03225 [Herpetosiphonaceae bacterium]|nr:hypothetical protein [Herpetosiphonaceae bacterium]
MVQPMQVYDKPSISRPATIRRTWLVIAVLLILALIGAFGNAWDLYWHIMIGRDTFWIPPHTMMYTSIALSGLIAAGTVLRDTLRDQGAVGQVRLLGFHAPLGYFVLGFGVLQMVLSAPFDDWWHRMYGVDVTVWSPPHLIGFSGATVMLVGLIILILTEQHYFGVYSGMRFWCLALVFALVVRWVTFLNSTSLALSWFLRPDGYAIVGPWAGWWVLWASLFMAWIFVASARCIKDRAPWHFPVAVCVLALVLRGFEFPVSAVGFRLILPWGTQTLHHPFRPLFDYDLGLWVTTIVLALPTIVLALLSRWEQPWSTRRFGLTGGLSWGFLLALQFLWARPVFHLVAFKVDVQLEVVLVALLTGAVGGLIGAYQGEWLWHLQS